MPIAREYLRLTKEATYGTYDASALAANIVVIDLPAPNSWTVRKEPNYWVERSAGGSNRPVMTGTSTYLIKGKLTTKLRPSQAKLLCGLAINLSGAPYDLGSFTADHAVVYDDGSAAKYYRNLGCKFGAGTIAGSNGQNPNVTFSFDVQGQKQATITGTDFPEPTYASTPAYPVDNPFTFEEIAGNLTLGTSRANLRSFSLNVGNELRGPMDELPYITALKWTGRANTLDLDFRFLSNTDRAAYEAATKLTASFALNDGVNTGTFQMFSANVISAVTDDLPWGDPGFYQKVRLSNMLDPTASPANDLTYAQAP